MKIEDLSDVLKAEEISQFLGLSKNKVYELMKIKPESGGIPTLRIGRNVRVLKTDLIEWLNKSIAKRQLTNL
jgi:excisionase family DNA binding protein